MTISFFFVVYHNSSKNINHKLAAFNAWLMGAGEKKTWSEFCASLFGTENEKQKRPPKVDTKKIVKQMNKIAEKYKSEKN